MLLQRWQLLALYACVLTALAWPVLWVDIPVGVDTLNHFARIHVRAHIDTDPDLARLFEVRDTLVPYLGMDWLLTPLVRVLDTLAVARLLTVALVWGTVGAVAAVQLAFTGRIGPGAAVAGLVAWNGLMAWGFLNYVLGLIAALLGFALWHAWRDRPALRRLAVFGALCLALYLTHLLALLVYAGLVGLHALVYRDRRWLVLIVQFVPPALLWLLATPPSPLGKLGLFYNLPASVVALTSPFLFPGGLGGADVGYLVLLASLALAGLLTRLGLLRWHRPLLSMAVAITLVSFAVPVAAAGISWINMRLPLVAACLAIAALRYTGPPVWGAVVAALILIRVASVTGTMQDCAPHYAELRQAMAALPRGVVLVPVLERADTPLACSSLPVYEHIGNLVTLERAGLSTDFFAQTPSVRSRGAVTDRKAVEMEAVTPGDLGPHVLWMHLGHAAPKPAGARVLVAGSFFDLLAFTPAD